MARNVCPQCGAPVDPGVFQCKYCGEKLEIPVEEKAPAHEMPQQGGGQPQQYATPQNQYPPQGQPPYGYQPQNQYPPQGQPYGYATQGYQQPYPPAYPQAAPLRAPQPGMPQYPQANITAISLAWPVKSKVTAGVLALLLGGIGIHKFYLGKIGAGILYLLFCWTGIPALIAFIEGISYLCSDDEKFQIKNHVRIV